MKHLFFFLSIMLCLAGTFSCKKKTSFLVVDFIENFDNSMRWALGADSLLVGGQYLPMVSKIEGGALILNARQDIRCTAARAIHTFDVGKLLGVERKCLFRLNFIEMSTSSSGNIDVKIVNNGIQSIITLKGKVSSPFGINFMYDGTSIVPENKEDSQGITFYTKGSSPSLDADGITIVADACGIDNFSNANVKIDAFVLMKYQ